MKWTTTDRQTYLNLIGIIILLVGLGIAILIYSTAENGSKEVLGYEIIDGQAYPIMPEDSKMYVHNLQVFGGKASVLMDEFRRWFVGLWHGKSLAFTVAFITIFISIPFFFFAKHLPDSYESDIHSDDH
ncbi:MAG: hypothetical protein NTV58_10070 [Deltaproteobacteria bacterium]|nr:hypothetical protein [Deltaproteobacteria bacterium]